MINKKPFHDVIDKLKEEGKYRYLTISFVIKETFLKRLGTHLILQRQLSIGAQMIIWEWDKTSM